MSYMHNAMKQKAIKFLFQSEKCSGYRHISEKKQFQIML